MRYTSFPGGGIFTTVLMGVMVLVGLFLIVLAIPGVQIGRPQAPPPFAFVIIWLAILALNVYMWLWRMSYTLESDGRTLRWSGSFRHGDVSVGAVESVGVSTLSRQIATIRLSDGRSISIQIQNGFAQFVSEGIFAGREAGFAPIGSERLPRILRAGGSGFRRLDK